MTFDLRKATPQDEIFVKSLLAETISHELGASDWPPPLKEQVIGQQVAARYAAVHRGFPSGESWILRSEGESAGWLYFARLGTEVRLVELLVANRLRRNGLGTAAIRYVIESAGNSPVSLHVQVMNTGAIRLYERLGFTRSGGDEINLLMHRAASASC